MLLYFFNLFISGAEIAIILFIAVIFFGADKIPDIARNLGKGLNEIKHATNDIKREIRSSSRSSRLVDTSLEKIYKVSHLGSINNCVLSRP